MSKQCTTALNCYVAKALPVKYQNTAHRLYMAYRFVTLLSKKNALAGCQMQRNRSCTKILCSAAIALNYSVKNIWNDVRQIIYIWKITIQLTSVGLAHTHPNYLTWAVVKLIAIAVMPLSIILHMYINDTFRHIEWTSSIGWHEHMQWPDRSLKFSHTHCNHAMFLGLQCGVLP